MNPVTSTARDGRSVRWDRHRAERRLELVRAARSAVHALGAHASMEEIASHAGTSKTVYYRYFGDREGLRLAVSERVTAHMERRLLEVADEPVSEPEALRRMVEVYLTVAATSPEVYAFAVAPSPAAAEAPVLGVEDWGASFSWTVMTMLLFVSGGGRGRRPPPRVRGRRRARRR